MRGSIQVGIMLGMAFALCACTEAPAPGVRPSAAAAVSGEVEAPKIYSRAEPGLWDGRPSLGGIWVAHPGVKTPRRVLIRNTETGRSVAGALFRRERNLPGIPLQVSSDAAEALGMLAGAPARLSIVALERVAAPEDAEKKPPAAVAKTAAETPAPPAPVAKPPAPAKAPASVSEQKPADAGAAGYYVQLGLFGVEENARQAVDTLARADMPGEVRKQVSSRKTRWSVVAGPAKTSAEQDLLLKKIRGLGYADAYAVRK